MMTTSQIKYIKSLQQQKYRKEHNAYIVEGDKIAKEYLKANIRIQYIICMDVFLKENEELIHSHSEAEMLLVKDFELQKISLLKTPNQTLLVIEKEKKDIPMLLENEWALMLDTIQNPGNMGTIIRTADWFGIQHIICSPQCADIYNPKVVQATMGSLLRVNVYAADLQVYLQHNNHPVYATVLNGENIKTIKNITPGIILLGNESKGIAESLQQFATHKITITKRGHAESLNVAVAAGIICNELI